MPFPIKDIFFEYIHKSNFQLKKFVLLNNIFSGVKLPSEIKQLNKYLQGQRRRHMYAKAFLNIRRITCFEKTS